MGLSVLPATASRGRTHTYIHCNSPWMLRLSRSFFITFVCLINHVVWLAHCGLIKFRRLHISLLIYSWMFTVIFILSPLQSYLNTLCILCGHCIPMWIYDLYAFLEIEANSARATITTIRCRRCNHSFTRRELTYRSGFVTHLGVVNDEPSLSWSNL